METATQQAKKKPPKPPEKTKTDKERYDEIQAKPEHKRTVKEKEFASRYGDYMAAKKYRESLTTRVTLQASAFGNGEKSRLTRQITDKVAQIAPAEHRAIEGLQRARNKASKEIQQSRRQAIKELEAQMEDARRASAAYHDRKITAARREFQEQYKQLEDDLNSSISDIETMVTDFVELIPDLGDEQLEALLKGEAVQVEMGGVKDFVAIPTRN